MAKGAFLAERIRKRITESSHTLTVVYPAVRPVQAGSISSVAPFRPLTGTMPQPTLVPQATTPVAPPVTMPCLWMTAETATTLMAQGATVDNAVWVQGAEAMARVTVEDAVGALTSGTVFDTADYVEFNGSRWTVLKVTPMAPGFASAHSYAVWLVGVKGS